MSMRKIVKAPRARVTVELLNAIIGAMILTFLATVGMFIYAVFQGSFAPWGGVGFIIDGALVVLGIATAALNDYGRLNYVIDVTLPWRARMDDK